eukprot:6183805-Pleurochrysis_carterae.AAC.3
MDSARQAFAKLWESVLSVDALAASRAWTVETLGIRERVHRPKDGGQGSRERAFVWRWVRARSLEGGDSCASECVGLLRMRRR